MEVGRIDPGRLVFVDELGTHTSLAPLYAYAPIGERAFFEIPRNRGKNTTLLTSLHTEGMGPSLAVEGATTSRVFETYVKRLLAPAPHPGQVVVMDNLWGSQAKEGKGAHRGEGVRAHLPAILLPRPQPDRGSPLKGQAHPKEGPSPHQGDPDRGDGASIGSGERSGCTRVLRPLWLDRKSTRLNSSHANISYA